MKTVTRYNKIIQDAKTDEVIHVKPKDINSAVCRDHSKCVVAKAILRQKKSTVKWVDVGNSVVLIGTGEKTGKRYRLSRQAMDQIRYFDENDGRFAPCTVILSAPKVGNRKLGERAGESSKGGQNRNKKRRQPTR